MTDTPPSGQRLAETAPASETILDAPEYWFRLADEDQRNNPALVEEYRRLGLLMIRYRELRMAAMDRAAELARIGDAA